MCHIRDSLAYMINHPSTVCLSEKDSGNPVDLPHLMKEITKEVEVGWLCRLGLSVSPVGAVFLVSPSGQVIYGHIP